jgi:polyhydroxyalkanoate synthesis regulator phasin
MLHAVVSDLNTVPETFRPAYVEKNGKFVLNVTPAEGFVLENVTGLKSALDGERAAKEAAEAKLKPFNGLDPDAARNAIAVATQYGDVTPEKARQLAADVARLTAIDPNVEADKIAEEKVKRAKAAMEGTFSTKETEYQSEIKTRDTAIDGLKGQLRGLLVTNQIKAELSKLNPVEGVDDAIELLAERSIRTVEKDGKFEVQVVDAAGNIRHKLDGSTLVPLTVSDLMSEIKEAKPGLFQAEPKGGVGITPGNGVPRPNGGVVNPWMKDSLNRTEQAKLTLSNPTLAKQMKLQAGVA